MRPQFFVLLAALCAPHLRAGDAFKPEVNWNEVRVQQAWAHRPHGVFCIMYEIPGVTKATDLGSLLFVKPTPDLMRLPFTYGPTQGRARDYGDGSWCNGKGNVSFINEYGILIDLNLRWGRRAQKDGEAGKELGEYHKKILIPWKPHFEYKDDVVSLQADIAWFTQPNATNLVAIGDTD